VINKESYYTDFESLEGWFKYFKEKGFSQECPIEELLEDLKALSEGLDAMVGELEETLETKVEGNVIYATERFKKRD
jgi:hypothetical protein